jgi:hypothetical protein
MEAGKYLMGPHEIQDIEIWVYHKSDIDFFKTHQNVLSFHACEPSHGIPNLSQLKATQELQHCISKAIRIVLMNDVPTVKSHETSVWSSRCHLLELILRCNPAISTSNQESRTSARKPVSPMVTIESHLRFDHLTRFKREPPAI